MGALLSGYVPESDERLGTRALVLLGLAAFAVVAVTALTAAKPAAADVACKVDQSPCPSNQLYTGPLHAELSSTLSVFRSPILLSEVTVECTISEAHGVVTDHGGPVDGDPGDGVANGYLYEIDWNDDPGVGNNPEHCPGDNILWGDGEPVDTNGSSPGFWDVVAPDDDPNGHTLGFVDLEATVDIENAFGFLDQFCTATGTGDADGDGNDDLIADAFNADPPNSIPSTLVVDDSLALSGSSCTPSSATFEATYSVKGEDSSQNPIDVFLVEP